jgi:hypothetical protein
MTRAIVQNSVFAGNGKYECALFISKVSAGGHNLSSDASTSRLGTGNLTNVDAKLGPFGDYGGPTWTMPLLAGSPAIDAGDNTAAPATD